MNKDNKISILSATHASFTEAIFATLGKGRIHAGIIYEEFFRTGKITGNQDAFNTAKSLLDSILSLTDTETLKFSSQKNDGQTGKIYLQTHDHLDVETVLIPMQSGGTLCVSSQVGCRMGCAFCETGKMGLIRNLTTAEIVSQVFIAKHILGFSIRNIVFMGMGEPFDNYDHVLNAVRVICDPNGLGFGPRHITVSTSGCIEGINRLSQEGELSPNLAVSINAPEDQVRNKLMPINKKHDMQALYDAMSNYCQITKRQILAAYVLLQGINDSLEHAERLANYLQGLDVKINLIPYNHQTRDRFIAPDSQTIDAFANALRTRGYRTLLRATKGRDIMAACGQLGKKVKKSELLQIIK